MKIPKAEIKERIDTHLEQHPEDFHLVNAVVGRNGILQYQMQLKTWPRHKLALKHFWKNYHMAVFALIGLAQLAVLLITLGGK